MNKYILSIDPGMSTGVVLLDYDDDSPARVKDVWQVPGGAEGFLKAPRNPSSLISIGGKQGFKVIAEKFSARGGANKFAYRTEALEPLRVEGVILAKGGVDEWVQPAQQYFMGGKTTVERLKNRNNWLKEHTDLGYYITGKDVRCPDADDARSALSHAIAWLRRTGHRPTLELFRG